MVGSVSSNSNINPTQGCDDIKTAIAVKLFKEVQKSQELAGSIIQDTVEISKEAIEAYQNDKKV